MLNDFQLFFDWPATCLISGGDYASWSRLVCSV